MKATELRELSDDQLQGRLAELRDERFRLRFRSATEAINSPIQFRAIRRDIARIQTILRERAGQAR